MSKVAAAAQLFRDGCACSQAILAVYGEPLGLDRATALRISAGFAGGMRLGETCGAMTGAIMVMGLRYAGENCDQSDGRADLYARVVEFADRFRRQNGSCICRDLLGCDISTPDGMKQARAQNLFKTKCVELVESAATILEEMTEPGHS
jgi:C_GCAxxG_C_C family probable redox protein